MRCFATRSVIIAILIAAAALATGAEPAAADPRVLAEQAQEAAQAKDYHRAADLLRRAIAGVDRPELRYNLACYLALGGDADHALEELGRSIDLGFCDVDHLLKDDDLASLHADARFQKEVDHARARLAVERERQAKFAKLPPAPEVFALPVADPGERRFPLVVALHGLTGNPQDFFAGLSDWARKSGFALLAVGASRALNDTGKSYAWAVPGDIERVGRIVADVIAKQPIDRSRVYLLGFSQGGVMVYPVAFRRPELFTGVISMSGALQAEIIDPKLMATAAAKLPIAIIHGEQDQSMGFDLGKSAEERLLAAHFQVELYPFTGGHRFPPDFPAVIARAIGFLDAHRGRTDP
jgi:predicted esterase